jgi:hypothetical protein
MRTNKSNVTLHKSPCSPSHKDPEFFRRLTSGSRALTSGSQHPVQTGGLHQPHQATQFWSQNPVYIADNLDNVAHDPSPCTGTT